METRKPSLNSEGQQLKPLKVLLIAVAAFQMSTSIRPYNSNLQFKHAYFDSSLNDRSSIVQTDETALYQLSRLSVMSYNYFQFYKTFHGNLSTEQTYKYIDLEGYLVYGMCQNQGVLDYVIALHTQSREIRVMRLTYDEAEELGTVQDYKVVDKDSTLLINGDLYVDCKWSGQYRGINTYVVGILGSYLETNNIASYYLAKFNTKYNLTEYFVKSNDLTVMEIARAVRVDLDNKRIYIAIEINKNKYQGSTVYQPGALPGQDNSNVAIVGYAWSYATRLWVSVIGDEVYMDTVADLECYGNNVYAILNSFSTVYSTNSSQTDIQYYRMRSENGYIEKAITFGSPSDDKAFDLVITFTGPHLLALINSPFLPHRDPQKQWQTQNDNPNIALIIMDFQDQISSIEGYDISLASAILPYPTRFFINLMAPGSIKERYTLISHRSNLQVDSHGGLMITYLTDPDSLYAQTQACSISNCAKCNSKISSQCLECASGFMLWQQQCYAAQCPWFSYQYFDQSSISSPFCRDCHYTCKTCTGSQDDSCSACCTNGVCGSVYDRSPNLGKCTCPVGMKESNGICQFSCQLNLGATTADRCYPNCPMNSFPDLQYDQATAQEHTSYNPGQAGSCQLYTQHMRFLQNGQGLRVPGPNDFETMPKEFSIGFWVSPNTLNSNSFFLNAFGRIQIYTQLITRNILYRFMTGSSTSVSPTYVPANQVLSLGAWNYVAVSQREINVNNILNYEIQLGLATSNFGTVNNAGYTNSQPVVKYGLFNNMMNIGSFSESSPQSFTGYMKDLRVFNAYHGLAQMATDSFRIYRLYSYDDPKLVAYWKLTEGYTSSDIIYTIYDYSINQNKIEYSLVSDIGYPTFSTDTSQPLSLCYLSDVKTCRTLKYNTLPPVGTSSTQYKSLLLKLSNSLLIQSVGDIMYFVPNNTVCSSPSQPGVIASMTYLSANLQWEVLNQNLNPTNLKEATHYQLCYYDASVAGSFNMAQLYIAGRPRTIDPSTGHIYNRTGNTMQWMTGGGDQANGDAIRFSYDCNNPGYNQTEIIRSNVPDYPVINILETFNITGDFFFCWNPVFMQDFSPVPIYDNINNLKYKIQYEPQLSATFRTLSSVNEDIFQLSIAGTFVEGDQFIMTWQGLSYSDCNPINQMGSVYNFNHSNWPSIWIGHGTGVYGINTTAQDSLQACWKPGSDMAPDVFIRIKKEDLSAYLMRIINYGTVANQRSPELQTFDPAYGSATLRPSDRTLKFNFKPQLVIPSSDGSGNLGKLIIYRGAIKEDGSFIKVSSQILWQNIALNENTTPDPLQQGDLICSQTGQCSIILSQDSSQMKAGEIYYLTFFSYSFLTYFGNSRYYLFNTKYPLNTPVYDHMFMCRSYDIYPSDALINGNTFVINGESLLSQVINAKWLGNTIVSDTFYTKAINIRVKVYNTDSYFCTFNRPTLTVAMEDVTQTSITIRNLLLRQCNEGQLFADYIEVIRGIRDESGQFTYLRSEKMYNIELGTIGCDSSCAVCNGTSEYNCQVCSDVTHKLFNGKCYAQCPVEAAYVTTYTITFQNLLKTQKICVPQCPYGFFNNIVTGMCTACNADCLTCTSAEIASCTSCRPNQQLYNGICIDQCPSPHHSNNYTSYVCNEIDKPAHLKVKILSLGYKQCIPKDQQVYLKADINNTGGGNISSIVWTQLQPDIQINGPQVDIFSNATDLLHDYTNQVVVLNNNALMKINLYSVVKVQCTVTNTLGEIAYDIYEFYVNDSPFIGNATYTRLGELSNSTGTTVDTLWQLNLTNWYDSPDDAYQTLKFKVFVIKNFRLGLNSQTEQYTLTDQTNNSIIYFRLPPFFIDQTLVEQQQKNNLQIPKSTYQVNVSICVQAEDIFYAKSTRCTDFNQVVNRADFSRNFTFVTQYINKNLSVGTNISDLLFATNMIYQSVQTPLRTNQQDGLCTLDIHCSYKGVCSGKTGIQKCYCDQGYFGTYCQFRANQLQDLRTISKQIISSTMKRVQSKTQLTPFDLEIIANVVRGVSSAPDLIDDEAFEDVISLLEYASNQTMYVHRPLDTNTTRILLRAFGSALVKINHSFKHRRANKDTLLLGMGLDLLKYTNQFQLSSNPSGISAIEEQPYYIYDASKPYLIGGISSSRNRRMFLSNTELSLYEEWGRRVDESFDDFLNSILLKLDPLNNQLIMKTDAYDLQLTHARSASFIGRTYIRSKDAYWDFPTNIWDKQRGVINNKIEIRQKVIKHFLNPFKFETNTGALLESNITTVEYFSVANNKIQVDLSGTSTNVFFREPFNTTMNFDSQYLRCMSWNEDQNTFNNDNSCSFQMTWEVIPCATCDQYDQTNTTVSMCRCKHLSRFGVVYESPNVTLSTQGVPAGIYSDFYAMQFWNSSFGYFATLAGLACFGAGHLFIWFIDRRMQHNLIVKLRQKIRRFELQHGASLLRRDGLFLNKEQLGIAKASKIASQKKVYLKENQDDVVGLMNEGKAQSKVAKKGRKQGYQRAGGPEEDDDEEIKERSISPLREDGKPRRRVTSKAKQYQEDDDDVSQANPEGLESEESMGSVREEDAYKFNSRRRGRQRRQEQFKMNGDFDENDRIIMKRLEEEKKKKMLKKFHLEDELDKKKDLSFMNPQQREQYERHQKIIKGLAAEMTAQQLYHKLMEIKHDDLEGMTKREFKSRIMHHAKRLPKDLMDDVKEYLGEIRGQLNSTDEEMFLNMKDIFIAERERREVAMFRLKPMIIHGSYLFSLFFVTSLLSPRHIRWSLFFCNVVMLWFICAVFYNNTKNPLAVPNFNTKASSLVFKDIWISFVAPWGSIILMYVLSSFLKMPNSQLLNVVTLRQLEAAIIEYRKESCIRFFMGYIIVFVIMGVIFWYLIQFTATFGWKVAWTWWYAGIVAIFLQFAIVDPLFSIANYFLYRVHKKAGRLCLKIRSVTQGYNELFENSDEEKFKEPSTAQRRKLQYEGEADANAIIDPENPPSAARGGFFNAGDVSQMNLREGEYSTLQPGQEIQFVNEGKSGAKRGNSKTARGNSSIRVEDGKPGTAGSGSSGSGGNHRSGEHGDADALTGHTIEKIDADMATGRYLDTPKKKGKKKKRKN